MMGFLKKFGAEVLKIAGRVLGVLPAVSAIVPSSAGTVATITNSLTRFIAIVQDVEVAGQAIAAPGPDKLKMATPLVAQELFKILGELNLHVPDDKRDRLIAVATGYASVTADLLNIVDKK